MSPHGILMLNLSISKDMQKAKVQIASGHGHVLEMKNTAYHSPYDLVDNKVNAIYQGGHPYPNI